jgi:hypothetical protein
MRALLVPCLVAMALTGCGKAVPSIRPMAAPAAIAAQGTVELRRAIRAHLMTAFDWADADHDDILVLAEAERLGIAEAEFRGRDKDANGALSLVELQGATYVTDEVRRLRELAGTLLGAAEGLDRAAWNASPATFRPLAYTPAPSAGIKATLFAPADTNADGRLDRRELEGALGRGVALGYEVGAARDR